MRARLVFALASLGAMGCTALIGVRDIYLDEDAASADGGSSSSSSSSSGGTDDAGDGGTASCVADLQTSKDHCGRCDHSCGGGECVAGKCQAVQIGVVAGAPLLYIAVSAEHVFVAPLIAFVSDTGGLWRIPKSGGTAELFADIRYAEAMRVVGDKIYFVVEDDPGDGGPDQTGGLWSCPLASNAPCQPTRAAGGDNPDAITVDGTRVFFNDSSVGTRAYDTATGQTATINDKVPRYMYAEGTSFFYNFTYANTQPYTARTLEAFPDGGTVVRHEYTKTNAGAGVLVGTTEALYVAALDFKTTTGGVVHRYPRAPGLLPCDYGGDTNKRPYGIAVDGQRIYWTNVGEGADEPFTGGSVATCELAGCCTTPETLWTGDGMPRGIVADDAFVYWVAKGTGAVWKVAKP